MTLSPIENPIPAGQEPPAEQVQSADSNDISTLSLWQMLGLLVFRPRRTASAIREVGQAEAAGVSPDAEPRQTLAQALAANRHLNTPALLVAAVVIALFGAFGIAEPQFRLLVFAGPGQPWPLDLTTEAFILTNVVFLLLLIFSFYFVKVILIPGKFYRTKFMASLALCAVTLVIFLQSVIIDKQLINIGQYLALLAMMMSVLIVVIGVRTGRLRPLAESEVQTEPLSTDRMLVLMALRVAMLGVAGLLSFQAWDQTQHNTMTDSTFVMWIVSIFAWFVLMFDYDRIEHPLAQMRNLIARITRALRGKISITVSWTGVALLAILLMGAWFRFRDITSYPPDMTSDHVEMAMDVWRVTNGARAIFFPNNGGREGFNMYYLAALHQITGMPINFTLLKFGSGLQGMLLILLMYWAGRAIFGPENRKLGNLVGLIAAAMVASSYWEVTLSRLGERLALTAVATTLVIIFLARAMRYNRRLDWLLAGLVLGGGMYFYQAVRMLPVVVVAGFILAILWRARTRKQALGYVMNFAALVIMALVVFIPLARYWNDYPQSFWERTSGRLLGEDTIEIKDKDGNVTGTRYASLDDRLAAFQANLPVLFSNYRKSLFMFNISGDSAWITGDPTGTPELDFVTGAFLLVGVGVVIGRMVTRRDPVDWLLPTGVLVMILPTALSIAFVIEVPSASRASGAMPFVYLIAALGMGVVIHSVMENVRIRSLRNLIYGVSVFALLVAAMQNADSYFVGAMAQYRNSTLPHHQAGTIMSNFINSTGAPGNVFMIGWVNGWDHRALAIEAGLLGKSEFDRWDNGILWDKPVENVLTKMSMNLGTRFELRPDRQILFFLDHGDTASLEKLQAVFGPGQVIYYPSFKKDRDFLGYIAPPVGCDWFKEKFAAVSQYCVPAQETGATDNGK